MGEVNIEIEKFKEAVLKSTTEAGIDFQLKDKQILDLHFPDIRHFTSRSVGQSGLNLESFSGR